MYLCNLCWNRMWVCYDIFMICDKEVGSYYFFVIIEENFDNWMVKENFNFV